MKSRWQGNTPLKQTTNEAFNNAKSCKMVKTSPLELAKITNEKEHGELALNPKFPTLQNWNEKSCKTTNTKKGKFNTIKKKSKLKN